MPSFDEKLAELSLRYGKEPVLGLERVQSLLAKLGNPQNRLPQVIHVAGTNGKGSTIAFLKAFCEQDGKKVHVYNSPHFVSYRERITLAGEYITDDFGVALAHECEVVLGNDKISFFEFITALAFLAFSRVQADVLLLETGMGGRLDATNVVAEPLGSIITSVSLDHVDFLGHSLAEIAWEKAHILKSGSVGVIAKPATEEVYKVFDDYAFEHKIPLLVEGRDWHVVEQDNGFVYNAVTYPAPALAGKHQYHNAGLAITAAQRLLGIGEKSIRQGLQAVKWNGRLQRLKKGRLLELVHEQGADCEIWVDGGHNEGAAKVLAEFLPCWRDKPLFIICGMLKSKDADSFVKKIAPYADGFYAVPISDYYVTYAPEELVKIASDNGLKQAFPCANFTDAVKKITPHADGARIFICGSLYLLGEVFKDNA